MGISIRGSALVDVKAQLLKELAASRPGETLHPPTCARELPTRLDGQYQVRLAIRMQPSARRMTAAHPGCDARDQQPLLGQIPGVQILSSSSPATTCIFRSPGAQIKSAATCEQRGRSESCHPGDRGFASRGIRRSGPYGGSCGLAR